MILVDVLRSFGLPRTGEKPGMAPYAPVRLHDIVAYELTDRLIRPERNSAEIHGTDHALRTAILATYLGQEMQRQGYEGIYLDALWTAGLIHDSQRYVDHAEDPYHGARAATVFVNNPEITRTLNGETLQQVVRLTSWHDFPKNRERQPPLLLKIFQDADALDRVRDTSEHAEPLDTGRLWLRESREPGLLETVELFVQLSRRPEGVLFDNPVARVTNAARRVGFAS